MKYLKRAIAMGLAASMAVSLAACSPGSTTSSGAASAASTNTEAKKGGEIRLLNGKIEIDKQLKAYAKSYEEKTGVKVTIESLGGGVDIGGTLKGYLISNNMPDIFVIGGQTDYETWKDHIIDLDGEKWASDTSVAFKNPEGKVYGFPYAVEGYGIAYNKDILDKAGVDPTKLTNFDAYKAAFEKIDSMKSSLGLTAVASVAAESGQMYWSTANHLFGSYLAQGLKRDDTKYIDMLNSGKIDDARMAQFASFIKMLFSYSDKKTLISGTYDDQLALWATGKTAFITQGNWIDPSLPTYNAKFNAGLAPLAFTKENTDGVLADSPSWWSIYKDSKNIQAAKDFLTSLATTEEGAKCLVTDAGMISPFKSCKVVPTTPLAKNLMTWVQGNKTYAWQWSKMPVGIAQNATGAVFEALAKGNIDEKGFVTMMGKTVADYVAQNKSK
jgi:raffinose/stachyose/melibiose transport system substrate-binding protein